jgi:hypothetical protein
MRLCEGAGILCTRPLFRGPYTEAASFPLGFETTLPARLGLPSLGPSNKAEGIVIKPARAIVVPGRDGVIRPVIKRKIPEFSEDERFHNAEKWSDRRAPAPSASALDWLKYEASALVNENRLLAAVSKVGRVSPSDAAKLEEVATLVRQDLEAELASSHKARISSLSAGDTRSLARFLDRKVRALVHLYLVTRS